MRARTAVVCLLALVVVARGVTNPVEVSALQHFYRITFGPTDWGPNKWTLSQDPCCNEQGASWWGVYCLYDCKEDVTGWNQVIELNLPTNKLTGFLPDVICNLTILNSLKLTANNLRGPVPPCILQMQNLTTLNLDTNQFHANLSNFVITAPLQSLDLGYNIFIGSPISLAEVSTLTSLQLDGNTFYGPLPNLTGLVNLQTLNLDGCGFTGTFPLWAVQPNMVYLSLAYNEFSGDLPKNMGQMDQLYTLSLMANNFKGKIPESICNCTGLNNIHLSDNDLDSFPDCIWNLTQLVSISVANNHKMKATLPPVLLHDNYQTINIAGCKFSGALPENLGVSKSLFQVFMSNNELTGTIPEALANSSHIQALDMCNNQLYGTVPNGMGNMAQNEYLCLGGNNLHGTLPLSFLFEKLRLLDLSSNNFEGVLPPDWQPWNTPLEFLSVGENRFRGNVPVISGYQNGEFSGALSYVDLTGLDFGGTPVELITSLVPGLACDDSNYNNFVIETLLLSHMNISGPFSPMFFCMFNGLTSLNINNNNIHGSLSTIELPFLLAHLDISDNQISGTIPTSFGRALQSELNSFYLKGNSDLHVESGIHVVDNLPDFLSYTWRAQSDNSTGHFTCPTISNKFQDAVVSVDPGYYWHTLCNCSTGYYGRVNYGCVASHILCVDGTLDCIADTKSRNNQVVLAVGYYPSPNNSDVRAFLPCNQNEFDVFSPGCATSCNCLVAENASLTCPECNVCMTGYMGRVCSQCQRGYYHNGALCQECLGPNTVQLAVGLSATLSFAVIMFFFAVRLEPASESAPRTVCPYVPGNLLTISAIGLLYLGLSIILASADVFAVWQAQLLMIFVLLATLFLVVWYIMAKRQSMAAHEMEKYSAQPEGSRHDMGVLEIFLWYLQISFAVIPLGTFAPSNSTTVFSATNPDATYVFSLYSIANMRVGIMQCMNENMDIEVQEFLVVSLPVLYAVAIGMIYAARRLVLRCCSGTKAPEQVAVRQAALRDQAQSSALYMFNFLFFSAISRTLEVFNCTPDATPGMEGISYLALAPWVQCHVWGTWAHLLILAAVVFFVYMGIMGYVIVYLYRLRHRLTTPNIVARYGFIYTIFKPRVWWYGMIVLVRRVLVAVAVTSIPASSVFYNQSVVIILLGALLTHLYMAPFRSKLANGMETAGLSVIVTTLFASMQLAITPSTWASNVLRFTVLTLNGLYVLAFIAAMVGGQWERLRRWCCCCCPTQCGFDRAPTLSMNADEESAHILRASFISYGTAGDDEMAALHKELVESRAREADLRRRLGLSLDGPNGVSDGDTTSVSSSSVYYTR